MQDRLAQLHEFLKENPEDPFIHYAIASEELKLGHTQAALEGYVRLTQRFPNYLGTYYHLGKLYEQIGETQQAIITYQTGMSIAKNAGNNHAFGELNGALQWLLMNEDED